MMKAVSAAQGEADFAGRSEEAYREYVESLQEAADQGDLQKKVSTSLANYQSALREAHQESQRKHEEAYKQYVESLREVMERSNIRQRSEEVLHEYVSQLQEVSARSLKVNKEAALASLSALEEAWKKVDDAVGSAA